MTSPSTRERIVSAADALFYASGYDHTSFATIADAVGLSRATSTTTSRAKMTSCRR
ncbi:MAG: TetR/AcrR family transcriptional regulator [Burkholderiaceae bacterium]